MREVLLDSVYDSLKLFIVVFVIYIIFSFLESRIANKLNKKNNMSPLYGSLFGLIPQCGVSVVAGDLYLKRHISVGTLIAIFLSCSDEALPILLASGDSKTIMIIPLLIIKFIVGFITGFLIDLVITKKEIKEHLDSCDHLDIEVHTGCCNHHIDDAEEDWFEEHIWHPFMHSLKLLGYVLLINIVFGMIVNFIGENNLMLFLNTNKYVSPLFSVIIGLIPNCVSSVLLMELYINNGITFGALLAGLCVNAGLGLVFIFKDKKEVKRNVYIMLTLISVSLLVGYLTCCILGF